MRQRRSQAIVITHAVAFLNLGEQTTHNYVSRNASGFAQVDSIDAMNLTAMSEQAAELGLNRGQLLANIGVVLFVEGRADQIVITARGKYRGVTRR